MAQEKYKAVLTWKLEKESDGTLMNVVEGCWSNMEYGDVVGLQAAITPAIAMALGELGEKELEKKKKRP
jgi:hypothetical protein